MEISTLRTSITEHFDLIEKAELEAAVRAVFVGVKLWQAKHALGHGHFMKWWKKHIPKGKTQVNNYMRLAEKVCGALKVDGRTLQAITAESSVLELSEAASRRFVDKVTKHVGDLSLTELLIKHGIKGVGLKSELSGADAADGLTPEQQAAAARERAWAETFESVQRIRASLTEPERAGLLTDQKQIETLKAEIVEVNKLLDDRLANLRAYKA